MVVEASHTRIITEEAFGNIGGLATAYAGAGPVSYTSDAVTQGQTPCCEVICTVQTIEYSDGVTSNGCESVTFVGEGEPW